MKIKFFKSLAVLIFLPLHLLSAQSQFSGQLSATAGAALPYTSNSGDFTLGQLKLTGEEKIFYEESTFYAKGEVTYDSLESHSSSLKLISGRDNPSLSLKEGWWDYNSSWWAFRVGRQISAWGKADGLCVTDILCPKDQTSLYASDYSQSRLGIDSARLSLKNQFLTLDFWWIPFFTPSALPLSDGNPLKKVLFGDYEFSDDNISLPETNLKNSEYALKISGYFKYADISLYGFHGWDDDPTVLYQIDSQSNLNLTAEYEKITMLGADTAIPLGPTVLRLEGAFFPKRYIQTSGEIQIANQLSGLQAESSVRKNQYKYLAGIDWMPSSWTLTAQYYGDYIPSSLKETDRRHLEHCASLSVSRSLLSENLTLSGQGILGLNDFDSAIELSAQYKLTDQIILSLQGNLYNKGKDGKSGNYGKYKDLSSLIFSGKFTF